MGRVCHGPSLLWAELSSYRLEYYNVIINHDLVMTLTYFRATLTWVAYAFEWGKLLKWDA